MHSNQLNNKMDERVKLSLADPNKNNIGLHWRMNLHNLNMNTKLKELSRSLATICKQSESITDDSFKDFISAFNAKPKPENTPHQMNKPCESDVPSNSENVTAEMPSCSKSNCGNMGPSTCAGISRQNREKPVRNPDDIMRNLYFNSRIGKKKMPLEEPGKKKMPLEEPDYDDIDLSMIKKPAKKPKKSKVTDEGDFDEKPNFNTEFKTAKEEMHEQNAKGGCTSTARIADNPHPKVSSVSAAAPSIWAGYSTSRKLGKRTASGKFVSPMLSNQDNGGAPSAKSEEWLEQALATNSALKNIEPRMIELIRSEIMDRGLTVDWADIAGLNFAKQSIQEAVVWPMLRPDIFRGLRQPPKGILLFGPPGTGKTLIGKCVASQSKSTFFTISASSLTSKWMGEAEKMVRALFTVARSCQPAVIFIDEIDSLLSQRSDGEHDSTRRIKTEFLVQLDGATTEAEERLLVIGATNRPQELDEAARRRFSKRLYIPLPEKEARYQLIKRLMTTEKHSLSDSEVDKLAELSDGFSGADMRSLCAEACLGPIRSIDISKMASIEAEEVPAVTMKDFEKSLTRVRSSVSPDDLKQYIKWDETYGSGTLM